MSATKILAILGGLIIFGPTIVLGGMTAFKFRTPTLPSTATVAPTPTNAPRQAALDRLEAAIGDGLRAELNIVPDQVSCPDKTPARFTCEARVGSQTARVEAVKTGDGSRVSWEMLTEIYYADELVKELDRTAQARGVPSRADCGRVVLVFVNLGEPVPCHRTLEDGQRVQVVFAAQRSTGTGGIAGSGRQIAGRVD